MTRWQYKVDEYRSTWSKGDTFERWLSERGREGWELVHLSTNAAHGVEDQALCTFKRQDPDQPAERT